MVKLSKPKILENISGMFGRKDKEIELGDEYVELEADVKQSKAKINIRPFKLERFEDIKDVISAIRDGYTIAIINISPLREKDRLSLKRAIEKLKKTISANNGDIAGFGEDFIVATPSFATVHRAEEENQENSEIRNLED